MNPHIAVTSCLLLATTPEMLAGGRGSTDRSAEQRVEILAEPDKELVEARSKHALLRLQHKGRHPAIRDQLRRVITLEALAHLHGPCLPAR